MSWNHAVPGIVAVVSNAATLTRGGATVELPSDARSPGCCPLDADAADEAKATSAVQPSTKALLLYQPSPAHAATS